MAAYLLNISAQPHPSGNRIDLSWVNSAPDLYPWVKVVRREGTYPVSPEDGQQVAEAQALLFTTDTGVVADLDKGLVSQNLAQLFLNAGILLSRDADVAINEPSTAWRVIDGEQFYRIKREGSAVSAYKGQDFISDGNLRAETVYYYTLFPFTRTPSAYFTDTAHRASAMATGPYDTAGQMMELLPRVYHRYDAAFSRQVGHGDHERGELRRFLDIPGGQLDQLYSFARAILSFHEGRSVHGNLLPLLAQWIGWKTDYRNELDTQRNEIGNAPFIHKTTGLISNVEAAVKRISGWESQTKEFVHNVFITNRPEQLTLWQKERDSIGVWAEGADLLSLDYAYDGRPAWAPDGQGTLWLFYHTYKTRLFERDTPGRTVCSIWYKTFSGGAWQPSKPLTASTGIHKYPAVAFHKNSVHVFWSVYDEQVKAWHIEAQSRVDGGWSSATVDRNPFGSGTAERKRPLACTDNGGGLWLFWLEKNGPRWEMKYNRHDGATWQLAAPAPVPVQEGQFEDAFVVYHNETSRIYLFWSRKDSTGKRREIAYCCKLGTDPALSDWASGTGVLPKVPEAQYDDREPAALAAGDRIELFFSSNQAESWSIWQNVFHPATDHWESAGQITVSPYSQRDPLPLAMEGRSVLLFRSNQSISYESQVYKATETTDFRYSGSTTVDTRNRAKNELREQFDDFQTYTYETDREDDNWYARDTVGMYLTAGTGDPRLIDRNRGIIKQLLAEIMPVQVRPVFVIETVYEEKVYTDDFPKDKEQRHITEQWDDSLSTVLADGYGMPGEAYVDAIPEWIRLHAVDCRNGQYLDQHTVNCAGATPASVETKYRTWHTGLQEE